MNFHDLTRWPGFGNWIYDIGRAHVDKVKVKHAIWCAWLFLVINNNNNNYAHRINYSNPDNECNLWTFPLLIYSTYAWIVTRLSSRQMAQKSTDGWRGTYLTQLQRPFAKLLQRNVAYIPVTGRKVYYIVDFIIVIHTHTHTEASSDVNPNMIESKRPYVHPFRTGSNCAVSETRRGRPANV